MNMKELTIEQKAKAYDEALNVAQETYTTQPMYREWLAKMFPELKESEDERIRKALIRFHKSTIDVDGIKGEDIIAWLENHGEQKPADKVEPKFKVGDIVKQKDNPHLTYILKRFTDDGDYEFHAIGKDGHEGCTCFSIVKYQDEWELVEQKPAETEKGTNGNEREIPNFAWNEEDEEMLNSFLHKLEVCDLLSNKESIWIKNKLKSLKDRVGCETNCTTTNEWSEEDEESILEICNYLDRIVREDEDNQATLLNVQELKNWLKSLRPQKHWKPTGAQLASLEIACDRNDRIGFELTELLKGLKKYGGCSMLPQWKPSDKQIDALDYYANSLYTYCDRQDDLRSLFNDLKRLREE